ncbi:MAG: ERAP1-like C-terminal domain-containing protein, partial [Candidatus Saccharimonas sp.]
ADSFETAKAGYSDISTALKLLATYANEDNASVWDIIASNIGEIRRVMDDERVRDDIKPLILKLTANQLKRLGWDEKKSDSYFDRLLRPMILGLASSADEPSVVKEAISRFTAAKKSEDTPADLRGVVYSTAVRHGDIKTFEKLLKFHESTNSSDERMTIAVALSCFEQPALYQKTLALIMSDTVRHQDVMTWLAYSLGNRFAKNETWAWLQKNWDWLDKNLGNDLGFARTPIYTARSFSDKVFLKEFKEFFTARTTPGLDRSIEQGLEMLKFQIGWKQRDLKTIQEFLRDSSGEK